jgi:CubicO group peptidase (beta-lactamase class C family)
MKRSLLVFTLVLICAVSKAQDNTLAKSIDSLVSPQFTGNQPGISILIAKKGQIVYQKAFGSANVELNTPMTPDNVFRIGRKNKG